MYLSPQPFEHKVNKEAKYHHTAPENPLILFRPPFHHSDRVSRNPHGRANRVQLPLRSLQHFPLISQVAKHCPSALQILVKRRVRRAKEALLSQRMVLPALIISKPIWRLIRRVAVHTTLPRCEIRVRRPKQRVARGSAASFHCSVRVGILRSLAGVRSPTEQL